MKKIRKYFDGLIKNLKRLIEPLDIIRIETKFFLIWFIFTILAGQIGFITNVILKNNFKKISFVDSLIQESSSGNFYVYSIVLFASTIGLLFVNIVERNPTNFKTFKVFLLIITIFCLFFGGIYYSSATLKSLDYAIKTISSMSIDWPQSIFLILSVITALYTYCITRMDLNYDRFKHLDDNYAENDDKRVEQLDEKASDATVDKKGNKLDD